MTTTSIKLMSVWEQHQHLNFGEIRQVVEAASQAASDKVWELTKKKMASLGRKCTRCGATITGEFVPGKTCRNTEACKRRAAK